LSLVLLLILGTGCPHTWGREGYVQKMLHRNIINESSGKEPCRLDAEQWVRLCGEEIDHSGSCPEACPLQDELEEE
jgi:hypothetical protein